MNRDHKINKTSKIYVAGHNGMVGSAIVRKLKEEGFFNIIQRTSKELDLTDQKAVADFFCKEKPEYVFLAAAKVGGIVANNTYRGQFIYENLMIQNNVIHQSYITKVKKLLFLGSSCIYPRLASQPIKEEYLLTGTLEPTNEPYAIAKIAGIKMCEAYYSQYGCNFISVMPTNLYGPNDNYDLENSHVLPALIRKMHLGKALMNSNLESIRSDFNKNPTNFSDFEISNLEKNLERYGIYKDHIVLWGTGSPYREFLHVDDLAEACLFLMKNYNASEINPAYLNIGCGEDLTIKKLAELVKEITGYKGQLIWDKSKPDGTPKKQLDISRISNLGWKPFIKLNEGIKKVYEDFFIS